MIKIKIRKRTPLKIRKRLRNKARLRKKVFGVLERPRLVVFRSQKHIYAQLIDDASGRTLLSSSTLKLESKGSNCEGAQKIGQMIAEKAF